MKIKRLIAIILIFTRQTSALTFDKFICDSKSKLNELKSVQNLFMNDNKIYMVLKNITVFFDQVDFIQNEKHLISIVIGIPFYVMNSELPQKAFGHLYDYDSKQTYEIQRDANRFGLIYRLEFAKPNIEKIQFTNVSFLPFKFITENIQISSETKFIYAFATTRAFVGRGVFVFLPTYENECLMIQSKLFGVPVSKSINYTEKFDDKIDHFVAYVLLNNYKIPKIDEDKTIFFQINNESKFLFQIGTYLVEAQYLIDDWKLRKTFETEIELNIEEFFSCYTDKSGFNELNELKGIYFDRTNQIFYIIINRFFRIIKIDLVQNGFDLSSIRTTSQILKFDNQDVKFEIKNSKWTKAFRNADHLVTAEKFIFNLNADSLLNSFKNYETANLIDQCVKQTLTIGSHVFCFERKEYFYLTDLNSLKKINQKMNYSKFKIANIFNGSAIKYDSHAELHFLFNYKNDQFVLMTNAHLFVFEYDKFYVNNEDKTIGIQYSSNETVMIKANCLFIPALCRTKLNDCPIMNNKSLYESDIYVKCLLGCMIFLIILIIYCLLKGTKRQKSSAIPKKAFVSDFLNEGGFKMVKSKLTSDIFQNRSSSRVRIKKLIAKQPKQAHFKRQMHSNKKTKVKRR